MRLKIAGVALLATFLTACGGGEPSGGGGGGGSTDPDELSATITYWDTSDPTNERPAFKKLVDKFNEKYPNVTVKYQSIPFDEAQNKFKTAASAGQGAPDVLRAEVAWVPEFAAAGHLYALEDTDLVEGNFLETAMSSNVYDGHTYGVPQVTDTLGLMYNKKLFAEAGIEEPPSTWDEVAAASKKLKQQAGVDGIYLNSAGYYLMPFLYGEGGDLVDTDAEKIVVDSDENVAGISTAQDLVKSGAAVKPDAEDAYGSMMTLFKSGEVGMILNGPWEVANIASDPEFGGFGNLGIAPVPAGSAGAGAPVGGHNYVIYSGVDGAKAEASAAFVKFMSSPESEAFIAEQLGLLPGNADAYDLLRDNAKVSAWTDVLEVAKPRPWIPEGGLFFTPLDEMATEVMVKGTDPRRALKKVADTYASDVVPNYSGN